jgi:putative membrane protein
MKKNILFAIFVTLIFATYAFADSKDVKTINEIVQAVMQEQGVKNADQINCSKVTNSQFEELGEAVMGVMHPDPNEHEIMDRMMGGEGSATLGAMHRMMGARYLGCYSGGVMGRMMPGMMGYFENELGPRFRGMPWGMMHRGYGTGYFGGMFMWIITLVLVILVIYLVSKSVATTKETGETALDILKKRYARGEISKEEFEEKKRDL